MVIQVEKMMIPVSVALLSASVLLVVRGIVLKVLSRWAGRTDTAIDDLIIGSLKTPSVYWCLAIGLYIGAETSELPHKYVFYFSKAIHIVIVLSITLAIANLTGKIFENYVQKSNLPVPTTGLAHEIGRARSLLSASSLSLVFSASRQLLSAPPWELVVSVALALQDTLANLFAGIHILMEKSIRVGDFIKLETGQEGYVEDITWRTTRVERCRATSW